MPPRRRGRWRPEDDLIDWFTITYSSIYRVLAAAIGLAVASGAYYWVTHAPQVEVRLDVPSSDPTHARFTWIEGNVRVKAVGSLEWVGATVSLSLKKNDLVRTAQASAAEIAFFDGTLVHVRPDSLITVEETSEDPSTKERRVAWHISSGEVNFETGPRNVPGSSTTVSTPTARGRVGESSSASVRVGETGATDVRVFQGAGDFSSGGGDRTVLVSGEALRVDSAGQAAPKVALPSVPSLASPQIAATVADPAQGASLRVAWAPVAAAAAYRLVVDDSPRFEWPLVDRSGVRDTSVELRGLDEGRYYWRVAAVGREGLEGPFSEPGRLVVSRSSAAANRPPPPLAVDLVEVRGVLAQVKGRTAPAALVEINGQRADIQPDGSFNEFVRLGGLGAQEVLIRVMGADGGVLEHRRRVVVSGF